MTYSSGGGNDIITVIFVLLSIVIPWIIVYSAVRVAIGPLRQPMVEPTFSADGRRLGDRAQLELSNTGKLRAFHLAVGWNYAGSPIDVAATTLDPGASVSWEASIPPGEADNDIYWLTVRSVVPSPNGNKERAWYVPVYLAPDN